MTHVQAARHVWRRNHQTKGFAAFARVSFKHFFLRPIVLPLTLGKRRVVLTRQSGLLCGHDGVITEVQVNGSSDLSVLGRRLITEDN